MHVFYNDPTHGVLMRCGVVKELTETVVTLDKADGIKEGTVQLTQRTAWQPITVTYEGIEVRAVCYLSSSVKRLFYLPHHDFHCSSSHSSPSPAALLQRPS